MKRILLPVAVSALVLFSSTKRTAQYPVSGTVTEVNYLTETVTFSAPDGNEYAFTLEDEWNPGDNLLAVMDDNGTAMNPFDDKVVSVRYDYPELNPHKQENPVSEIHQHQAKPLYY